MNRRDFAAELAAAAAREDWEATARIWEERRIASVEADEQALWLAHGNDAIFNRRDDGA